MPAIVVGITPEDYAPYGAGQPAGRHRAAAALGSAGVRARRRRATRRRGNWSAISCAGARRREFGAVLPSYTPGRAPGRSLRPRCRDYAIEAIREALPAFDRQIKGFAMHDAVLTGVETRTSSPVRITRGEDGHSLNTRGLFPAGEGAGYAGGILSAGVDGIKTAEAVAMEMVAAGMARAA